MQTLPSEAQSDVQSSISGFQESFSESVEVMRHMEPGMQMVVPSVDANTMATDLAGYERSVCGAMFIYPEAMISAWRAKVGSIPNPGNALFFFDRTRAFFKNALLLHKRGLNIDPITMARELPKSDFEAMGGLVYAIGHVDYCFSFEASVSHLDAMIREHRARHLQQLCQTAMETATDTESLNSAITLLNEQATKLLTIDTDLITPTEDICVDVIERLTTEKDSGHDIPTAFRSVADFVGDYKRGQVTLIGAPPGNGKCLGRGTPVLMFDGTVKAVEDVQNGDVLMGPDSKPRFVRGTMAGYGPLFRVNPVKGDSYVVNHKHVLSLKLYHEIRWRNGRDKHRIVNIPVHDYMEKSRNFKARAKGWRAAVDFPAANQPIPPYILGCWLGDGHTGKPNFTTEDPEVVEAFTAYARESGIKVRRLEPAGKAFTYSVGPGYTGRPCNSFLNDLRAIGVWKNKHIPLIYKAASREQRMELLAGLIDTDGAANCGGFDYVSKLKTLADDVAYVARSLGLAAYVTECQKGCPDGKGGTVTGTYHRVIISGDVTPVPVRIKRKASKPRKAIKDVLVTGISVEPIGDGEFFGFEVDADHLFLLGDFTVTHNTAWAMQEIDCALRHEFVVDAFLMESSFDQFSERFLMRNYAIRGGKFKTKFFTREEHGAIQNGMEALTAYKHRFHMAPMENYTAADIDAVIQKRKAETGLPCDLIVIDHLATMNHPQERGMSQYEASKRTVHQLRSLAARENAAMLLMDQLSVEAIRNSFKGGSKLPTLAAFRGGTPVESAKVVIILHKDEQDMLRNDSPVVEQRVVICKANDGQTGYVRSLFLKPFAMHIEDISQHQRQDHAKWLNALNYPLDTKRKDVK